MIIKVQTYVFIEVADKDQAEEACMALGQLDAVLTQSGFPHGEAIETDVDHYEVLNAEEIADRGLAE